ncbi:putative E3 ubiquitin-protein ligase sinah [Folsomia candida]|uniref:Putative E3 ubiquitin-protein ligase sinah n=1 Tax=Folsomia candida TaxID=158441 RepID=A0A226CV90_FOLCA|nr:putative E3 ubiquitin-protein ligase sinah [Folsomia candida]
MAAHKQTAPPPNLLDALECTICLDTPVSPIHECDNGHIVCGVCAERMTECGMCKTKLQISKLAERLSRQLDLKTACSNATSGCLTKVSAAEVRTHQVKCCYRDVICEDQRWPPCDKVSIPFRDFVNHLQTIHQIELEEIITGKMFPVFGSDQFRAHKQTAPPPNLLDALECTICLDTPVSPIHECDNGHIVCGVCAERMTECGMCKTKLQISKLAERLSRQLDLKTACSNATSGCLTKVSAAEVRTHQVKCCYRDVICEDQRWPPCDKVSIPFRDFVNHLQTIHQIELEEIITGKMFPVFGSDQFRGLEGEQILKLVKKNRKVFVLNSHVDKYFATYWMTVLGDEADAKKHWFQIKLGSEKKEKLQNGVSTSNKAHPIVYAKPYKLSGSLASSNPLLVEDRVWFRPSDSEEHQYTAQLTIKHASTNEETLIIRIHGIASKAVSSKPHNLYIEYK